MGWIKVDDSFYDNDKMLAVGTIGRDLYWHGMGYCNRNLTDGLIPRGRAVSLVDFTDAAVLIGACGGVDGQDCAPIAVARLLEVNLWHEDGHTCPDCAQPGPRHYIVHDYLKYQFSKAQIEEKAAATKKRVEAWRKKNEDCNDVGNAVTDDVQTQADTRYKHDNPTPNPTPISTSLVTKEGGVAFRNARDGAGRPICSKHPNGNDTDENCRGCMKARQWDESHASELQADELEAKRRAREISEQCPDCHGTNVIDIADNEVRKCDHRAAVHA